MKVLNLMMMMMSCRSFVDAYSYCREDGVDIGDVLFEGGNYSVCTYVEANPSLFFWEGRGKGEGEGGWDMLVGWT